ncbi:hypothetical protein GH714_017697 [Hevea brasiliensis]|uniref:Leucine-rich repeat-containing N-terminal plant-type domain-containing protein n=1 Tax=Hevea brasiliensis TaxID=3981 RepID=A0A6A6N633_HEVBR|nr:hypothetical protein GH714_017697 [Hevea brasiliensis]
MKTFSFLWIICLLSAKLISGGVAQLAHCNAAYREALLDLKRGLNDSWNRLSSWHGANCCKWSGIACDNTTGAVLAVDLPNSSVPPKLGNFSSLQFLDVSCYGLTVDNLEWGNLPTWFVNISSLVSVDIRNSKLTERILLGFGELPNLQ